ncbi:hypothetical protein [Streptomyces sp. NPDC020681]|uniref:hypothetical protein n=1 Tax=Streptomyces sp. NPDC020681 TaxID=3365083 RepID=UPI0037AF2B19
MSGEGSTYSVVRIAQGDNKGLPVLLLNVTDDDVETARQRVRDGDIGCMAVLRVVISLLVALGVDPSAYQWSAGEYVELLEMLGMPPYEWSSAEDVELTGLLAAGMLRSSGGVSDG